MKLSSALKIYVYIYIHIHIHKTKQANKTCAMLNI